MKTNVLMLCGLILCGCASDPLMTGVEVNLEGDIVRNIIGDTALERKYGFGQFAQQAPPMGRHMFDDLVEEAKKKQGKPSGLSDATPSAEAFLSDTPPTPAITPAKPPGGISSSPK